MSHLDKIDASILKILQSNSRLTSEELGGMVNLSPSACQRRVKRLRNEGIIEADVAIVSPKRLGRGLTMLVMVTLERERADIVDRFKRAVIKRDEVMMAYYITGEADFLLVVTAKDVEEYDAFIQTFLYNQLEIKTLKTMVVMDRVKVGFKFPIDIDDGMFAQ